MSRWFGFGFPVSCLSFCHVVSQFYSVIGSLFNHVHRCHKSLVISLCVYVDLMFPQSLVLFSVNLCW